MTACPLGYPDAGYRCRFCSVPLHSGSSDCECGEHRVKLTLYATLCQRCAAALDTLHEDTVLGRVHRALVHEADMAGRPSSDDW